MNHKTQQATNEMLSLMEAAPVVGVSPFTLRAWVRERKLPFFRCGRRIVFRRGELEQWLRSRRVAPADEAPAKGGGRSCRRSPPSLPLTASSGAPDNPSRPEVRRAAGALILRPPH